MRSSNGGSGTSNSQGPGAYKVTISGSTLNQLSPQWEGQILQSYW